MPLQEDHRTYVLKTYSGIYAKTYFDIEVANHLRLISAAGGDNPPGVLPFVCAFRHDDTYNLMTEQAAGGSLKNHLDTNPPPTVAGASVLIWTALLEAMKGLRRIHDLSLNHGQSHVKTQYHGYVVSTPISHTDC